MQIEDGKNVIVYSVVLGSNAIHDRDLHSLSLSTETVRNQPHCLPGQNGNLLPQHRAMLRLELALANYMFLLARAIHRMHPISALTCAATIRTFLRNMAR
jgi:hypothetical protein